MIAYRVQVVNERNDRNSGSLRNCSISCIVVNYMNKIRSIGIKCDSTVVGGSDASAFPKSIKLFVKGDWRGGSAENTAGRHEGLHHKHLPSSHPFLADKRYVRLANVIDQRCAIMAEGRAMRFQKHAAD